MTQKTNAFQKTIYYIHKQLECSEAKVIESALLPEKNIEPKVEREIDVLIEREEKGIFKRIALECRDRHRADDLTWIDSLIGKYLNLEVDRVIAVSSSGFSASAIQKAKACDIELRAISEIKNIDWNTELIKIGICDWKLEFEIQNIIAEIDNENEIEIKDNYEVNCGGEVGQFSEFFEVFKEKIWNNLFKEKFNNSIPESYKIKDDLSKFTQITHRIPISDFELTVEDKRFNIIALKLFLLGKPTVTMLNTRQFRYVDSLITKTELRLDENKSLTFYTSQANENKSLQISIDKKVKRK